ncbi:MULTISPECIES: HAD family hydrolase [Bradyrhizobium]|uniref:phosphoglycolate phosphatase n=3 Tax=Bradyrhizobium TaxID=374 RepID=A0A410VHL5_9BRAD|nr:MULTISPECIES: HAD hydrolase-like protein [Bradyrhizobium]MCG2631929.1 HAD hydrolase-like protein [Bradyrhizobium zhengyangense]MCG2644984.1 HAD hydrolase-like protein [Bradyrhizobium zhengyangense]MCG2672724.1 HAD hydrolase-like protein [Bradyrhizobium zhengyangense]MDN4985426.1 HAD hydrolase-like protein [Bradyrhizobium sp. WYCCWR 13022]MDN5002342.1 HAD hydrolase-like protein [Bradyrhizobium sp. WYCCWR 12677]
MKPVLVFDWNGTLLDDTYALLQTTNAILDRFGHATIDMSTFREHCDVPLSLLYRSLGMSQDEVATVDRDGSAIFHDTYEPLAGKADLREGARRVLELAHQEAASSIIVSNHIVDPLRSQLRRLGIDDYINDVLAFENRTTQYKSMSKGERLRLYMQKNNLKPASTFIIGDMPVETDIARNLGLVSISITGGFVSESRLRAARPDYTINNHHELLPILQRHGFFRNA